MRINHDDFYTVYGVKTGLIERRGTFDYRPFKYASVDFMTKPILDLIINSQSTLQEYYNRLKDCTGILMIAPNLQFLYEFRDKRLIAYFEEGDCHQYAFNADFSKIEWDENQKVKGLPVTIMREQDEVREVEPEKVFSFIALILGFEMLKQYKALDFQIIAVNKSLGYKSKKEIHDETFETDFKFPVRIVDCKYVRTLIRSGEFKVRGFFRMQPYGSRENPTYQLKWIDEHVREKHTILKKEL